MLSTVASFNTAMKSSENWLADFAKLLNYMSAGSKNITLI